MMAQFPQPDPVPLAAPGWLFQALLMLTFFLHLVPMNLVLGGSLIGALARARAARGARPHEAELARVIARALPVLVSTAVTMGVATLLFLQVLYGRALFVSSILMGWWWLAVVPLLILAYYGSYLLAFRDRDSTGAALMLAWTVAAIFGLVALIYGNNMTLMLKPASWTALYAASGSGHHLNLQDASLLPRHLHTFLGAIAVSGLGIALLGALRLKADPAFGRWAVRYGAFFCGAATALNVFAGLWWLATLPMEILLRFMGQDIAAMAALLGGIFLTFSGAGLLVLGAASTGGSPRPYVAGSAACLLPGILLMLFTRDTVRRVSLDLAGFKPVDWTAPQWGPIAIFVVLLIVALATIAWMARALARGSATTGETS